MELNIQTNQNISILLKRIWLNSSWYHKYCACYEKRNFILKMSVKIFLLVIRFMVMKILEKSCQWKWLWHWFVVTIRTNYSHHDLSLLQIIIFIIAFYNNNFRNWRTVSKKVTSRERTRAFVGVRWRSGRHERTRKSMFVYSLRTECHQ